MDRAFAIIGRIAEEFLHLYLDLAFYLLLGLAAAGLIATFVRRSFLRRAIGGRGLWPVFKASLLGIPLPLCSCSVVPMAMSLRRQGASRGATLSFLVSTPETGEEAIAVTYALLGPVMAVVRPVAAILTAFIAGAVQVFVDRREEVSTTVPDESCSVCDGEESDGHLHGFGEKIARSARYAYRDFFGDVIGWMLIGLVLASVVGALVDPAWVERNFSSSALQIAAMLVISVPLYVCASASTPVAASLIATGFSPGAALVLLLAGPATNAGTILMVWRFLGRRSAIVYVIVIVVVSAIFGFAFDAVIGAVALDPKSMVARGTEALPAPLAIGSGIVLAALTLFHFGVLLARRFRVSPGAADSCGCGDSHAGATGEPEPKEALPRPTPGAETGPSRSVDTADAGS